jgi:hypothetical protein
MDPTTSASLFSQITLPSLAIGLTALLLAVLLPLAMMLGHVAGTRRRARLVAAGRESDTSGDTSLGAILALLGLLLAFTFGNALSVSQASRAALTDEAAALGTAFLRADYLPDPGRTALQSAILDYAKTRVLPDGGRLDTLEKAQTFLDISLRAQARLWPLTLAATADPVPAPIQAFVAAAVNQALDAHLYRMQTFSVPVSEVVYLMMLAAALSALFLIGSTSGVDGRPLTARTFVFAGILFVVMVTIIDTQRGTEGLIRADDSPLRATIFDMEQALQGRI